MHIGDFTVEWKEKPIGIDTAHSGFSWKIISDEHDVLQSECSLSVYKGSEKVYGYSARDEKSFVVYNGEVLEPFTQYDVRLSVKDNRGNTAEGATCFETGKINGEFSAKFIAPKGLSSQVYTLSKKIALAASVKRARLYATAHGLYECRINGKKAGDLYFAPYWTDYRHTLEYQTYDVTDLLREGENDLQIIVGKGWYAGTIGFVAGGPRYGERTSAMAEIRIDYADGSSETVVTDESWRAEECFIRDSEFYFGEQQDFTFEPSCGGTEEVCADKGRLVGQLNEPVRCIGEVKPVAAFRTPKGEYVMDFGQNVVGFVRLSVKGERGEKIVIRHAEILDEKGNFYTENLRTAKSEDSYVLSGEAQILQPHFTFHGFRYIQIVGREIDKENVVAMVLHSDMKSAGKFECSDKRINRLWENIVWGQRGNFVDVPTDCPQRDERLGWTGDANVFFRTATYNYNVKLFFEKWLRDLRTEQKEDGNVPHVIPDIMEKQDGAALWGDCATMIPWEHYLVYGDKEFLRQQYPSMKKWVEYVTSKCGENGLWQSGFQYGDWLALDSGNKNTNVGATDKYFVANVFYYVSVSVLAKVARELGEEKDRKKYAAKEKALLKAIRREYVTATGRLVSETQTACALALRFGIVQEEFRARVVDALCNNLAENKNHLNTGFAGTPYLLFALSENGAHEIATKVLFNDDYPGWLYEVKLGATTIWERWDGLLSDGSPHDPAMNSFNHYAYGSVGEFMFRKIAGIDCLEPGYKKILIRPTLTCGLHEVSAEYESVYGKISSYYECRNGKIVVKVDIPCNTRAEIRLPEKDEVIEVGSGHYEYSYATKTDLTVKRFRMEDTFGSILSHQEARDVMEQLYPGGLDGPMISMAQGMTVNELCAYAGEQGTALFRAWLDILNDMDAKGLVR